MRENTLMHRLMAVTVSRPSKAKKFGVPAARCVVECRVSKLVRENRRTQSAAAEESVGTIDDHIGPIWRNERNGCTGTQNGVRPHLRLFRIGRLAARLAKVSWNSVSDTRRGTFKRNHRNEQWCIAISYQTAAEQLRR